jgi:dTDP-glucose 4,6-dehydratase
MREKILVTGGAGFMGSALVRVLVDQEYDVFCYDNFVSGTASNVREIIPHDHILRGDVEGWKLMKTLSNTKPDVVFHLAADPYIPLSYEHPERFVRTNFEGTLNVLMTCKTFGVRRIIHYSTSEVYGSAKAVPMNEQHPTAPQSVYAVSKLAADHLCQVLAKEQDIPVVVVRPFNCYGPRETHPYVIPEIVSQLTRSDVLVLGNLEARRDFTYVDDTARAACMLVSKERVEGQVFNIGTGRDHSVKEIAEQIGLIMRGGTLKIRVEQSRLRPYDVTRLICDSSKLRNLTGWKPEVEMEEGLKKTVEWYKQNGCAWEWERRYQS